ncbi:DUF2141 domain-containing protein [Spirosoma sp. SC4-14]|uniref:DUF2141 domain-containing protein n=1 Tax=Spirosoma sp. SC4-14 TaxID=3128900 RepID=UPI0030D0E36A
MKTLLASLCLLTNLSVYAFSSANNPSWAVVDSATYQLTVVVSGINQRTGKLYIGLATDASSFTGESAHKKTVAIPESGDITVSFEGLKPGRYAVRVLQDLNDNQKMDFSGQMPAEPFGFSNVTMLMGPPSFDECSFELNENKSVQIRMIEL